MPINCCRTRKRNKPVLGFRKPRSYNVWSNEIRLANHKKTQFQTQKQYPLFKNRRIKKQNVNVQRLVLLASPVVRNKIPTVVRICLVQHVGQVTACMPCSFVSRVYLLELDQCITFHLIRHWNEVPYALLLHTIGQT